MPSLFNDDLLTLEEARAQTSNRYEAMALMGEQARILSRQQFMEEMNVSGLVAIEIEWQGPEMEISNTVVTFRTVHWVTRGQWLSMQLVRLAADGLKAGSQIFFVIGAIFFGITFIATAINIFVERSIEWPTIEILLGVFIVLFGLYKGVARLGNWGVPQVAKWVHQRVFAIRRIRKLSKTDIHRIELNWNEH